MDKGETTIKWMANSCVSFPDWVKWTCGFIIKNFKIEKRRITDIFHTDEKYIKYWLPLMTTGNSEPKLVQEL